jgi:hypothetical protein
MQTAIVGLPMVGKTSLFTILTGVHEAARVGSLEARVGVTKVPDQRLDALAKIFDPPKITFATVEYLDFPAISKEALRDPKYLSSLRVVDALATSCACSRAIRCRTKPGRSIPFAILKTSRWSSSSAIR